MIDIVELKLIIVERLKPPNPDKIILFDKLCLWNADGRE